MQPFIQENLTILGRVQDELFSFREDLKVLGPATVKIGQGMEKLIKYNQEEMDSVVNNFRAGFPGYELQDNQNDDWKVV